jgi:hypothetical protein
VGYINKNLSMYLHKCCRCNYSWLSNKEHPLECVSCRSSLWNNPEASSPHEIYIPLPQFDHAENRNLPFIGARCPYCRGTTGTDSVEKVQFCYSCDAIWNLSGKFVGVRVGIGVR